VENRNRTRKLSRSLALLKSHAITAWHSIRICICEFVLQFSRSLSSWLSPFAASFWQLLCRPTSHRYSSGPRESCGAYENRSDGFFHAVLAVLWIFLITDYRLVRLFSSWSRRYFWDVWNSVTANGSVELFKNSKC